MFDMCNIIGFSSYGKCEKIYSLLVTFMNFLPSGQGTKVKLYMYHMHAVHAYERITAASVPTALKMLSIVILFLPMHEVCGTQSCGIHWL